MHELVMADLGVEVVWRAFELRPDPVPTLDPKGEYLPRAWKNSVYPLAEKLGMTMKRPTVQPRSRLAHEAAHWARSRGRFDDFHAAIFRAFFERGEDIGQIAFLTSLALQVGLDGEALRAALERHEFEPNVLEDERAAESLRISGVPAFVAERRDVLSGVQSVESLRDLVARAQAMRG